MAKIYRNKCERNATETMAGDMNFNDVPAKYQAQVLEYLNEDGFYVDEDGNVFLAAKNN